jgi:hypothetical protein
MSAGKIIAEGEGWQLVEAESTREGVLISTQRTLTLTGPQKDSGAAVVAYLKAAIQPEPEPGENLARCRKDLEAIKANPINPEQAETADRGLQALHRATVATAPTNEQRVEAALEAGYEWHAALSMFADRHARHGRNAKKAAKGPRERKPSELKRLIMLTWLDWLEIGEAGGFSAFVKWLVEDYGDASGDVHLRTGLKLTEGYFEYGPEAKTIKTVRLWPELKELKRRAGKFDEPRRELFIERVRERIQKGGEFFFIK